MTLRPGSAAWLLWHELRMYFYGLGLGAKKGGLKRGMGKYSITVVSLLVVTLHVLAYFVVSKVKLPAGALPLELLTTVTAVMIIVVTIMLSSALRASVEALFERGDLDMLLSSPLSSRSIFTVRLASVVIGVAGIYLLFLSPLAHLGITLGEWRWLGVYPTVVTLAVLVSSSAMLFTLFLVRTLGVRRTRVVAQIIGAISGAAIFIGSQLFSQRTGESRQTIAFWILSRLNPDGALGNGSLLWLPARAMLGESMPMLAMGAIGVAAFLFTVHFTHRFFVQGVQQAAGMDRVAAPAGPMRFTFRRGLFRNVIVKEWRLILRDPQLISQVLMQLLYLLPLCFVMFTRGGSVLPGVGAALSLLCSSLAGALGWIIICAEDAPDLLLSAPVHQGAIRRAKVVAMAAPPLALVLPAIVWTGLSQPLAAVVLAVMVSAAVASASAMVLVLGKPSARGDFRRRGKGNGLTNFAETILSMLWGGLTFLLLWLLTKPALSPLARTLAP